MSLSYCTPCSVPTPIFAIQPHRMKLYLIANMPAPSPFHMYCTDLLHTLDEKVQSLPERIGISSSYIGHMVYCWSIFCPPLTRTRVQKLQTMASVKSAVSPVWAWLPVLYQSNVPSGSSTEEHHPCICTTPASMSDLDSWARALCPNSSQSTLQ